MRYINLHLLTYLLTMLNLIPVSFCIFFFTFRVRVRIRVRVKVRV